MPSLADDIYNTLKQDILYGKLKNGTVLREHKLTAQFLVSRTPVRHAMKRLEEESLVESRREEPGWVVRIVREEEFLEITNLYIILGNALAEAAIPNLTEEDIHFLQAEKQITEELVNAGDLHGAAERCLSWQNWFLKKSGLHYTFRLYEDLPCITNFRWLWNGISEEQHKKSVEENYEILDAICRCDVESYKGLSDFKFREYSGWCQKVYREILHK